MKVRDAAIGSVVFFFVAPVVVAGLIPWLIGRSTATSVVWPVQALGLLVGLAGLATLLVCFADFVAARGTPAPAAPTERLVIEGPYRFVRNPMYVAVVAVILGQALWRGSLWLVAYGALVWAVTATFVRFYEEPTLRRSSAQITTPTVPGFLAGYRACARGVARGPAEPPGQDRPYWRAPSSACSAG